MPAQQNLMDSMSPFIAPTSWIVMTDPVSRNEFKAFQWKGKRLDMKFEGGWSTASNKRACNRRETPEGYHLFRYTDKDTKCITHMIDFKLEEYGVTKKWVIITEISKGGREQHYRKTYSKEYEKVQTMLVKRGHLVWWWGVGILWARRGRENGPEEKH
jgi:hypothetical protein